MAMAHGGCRCPSSNELGAAQLTTTASGSGNGAWGVSMPELERARSRPANNNRQWQWQWRAAAWTASAFSHPTAAASTTTQAGARAAAARQRRRQRTAADTTTAHVHETPCSALACLQSHWQRDRLPLAGYEIARNICVRTGTAPRVLVTARRACSRNSTQRTCASAATASPVQPEVLTEQRLTRLQCQRRPA